MDVDSLPTDAIDTPADVPGIAPLTAIQARILGSLIEKEATTPETYPLTANAVALACNQKNNREPVLALEAGAVGHALREMEGERLIASVHGARAQRYEHRFAKFYDVTTRQQALLAVLMLRGPQTAVELHARCERLAAFNDLDDVRDALERLQQRTPTLVVNLGRGVGQRDDRYMHLLCGPVSAEDFSQRSAASAPSTSRASVEARVDALEAAVTALRDELAQLRRS